MRHASTLCVIGVALVAATDAAQSQSVGISTADAELLQRATCGSALPADQALLFGTVRNSDQSPRVGIRVAAMWTEAVITREGNQTLLRASVDTTASDGTYALCGIPRETRVTVRADADSNAGANGHRSGELLVDISDTPASERDLVIGAPTPSATVTGRVVSPNGTPLRGTLDVPGEAITPVTSDSSGLFRLDGIPRRSSQLRVRAVGYTPYHIDVTPDGPFVDLGSVPMPERVQELSELRIEETFASRERREFEERRRSLNGVFIDSAYLAQFAFKSANNLKMASPKIRGTSGPGGDVFRLRRGIGECFPIVFLNGVNAGRQGPAPNSRVQGAMPPNEMRGLIQRATRIEFYQATFAPPEFADFEGCGAMVIWLR